MSKPILVPVQGTPSVGLRVRLASIAYACERHGWIVTGGDIDLDARSISIDVKRGPMGQPDRWIHLAGSIDRLHMERYSYRSTSERVGRRGDSFRVDLSQPVFLGRTSGHAREILRDLSAYITANPSPAMLDGTAPAAAIEQEDDR